MKKLRMTLAASMLLFLTAIVLQSCLDDWDDKYDTLFAVGTYGKGHRRKRLLFLTGRRQ